MSRSASYNFFSFVPYTGVEAHTKELVDSLIKGLRNGEALSMLEDSIDARLALASLILEDAKEDEAISLLSPPKDLDFINSNSNMEKPWWLDGKIKLKLCHIYKAKGMLQEFVDTILPLVRESLYVKTLRPKVKKRLTISVLRERISILNVQENDDVFGEVRPLASKSDLMRASRARKLLQKKEEQKAADKAAGIDLHSDYSDDESLLCKALQSLQRYSEALEIINLTQRLVSDKLPGDKEEELQSLLARFWGLTEAEYCVFVSSEISFNATDPKHGFDYVRSAIQKQPQSIAGWNCYYKIASRMLANLWNLFTMLSHHQDAAREYLEAYKLMPECPLINLCVGTALINLTLGFRLQNKHQCLAQGLAFLYNNLQLTENSQEALYNIARAYHHVGLVSLAASYYEKVLATCEKDYPIPKLLNENSEMENMKPGYCDLHREAAYNLHLIYKNSGAFDLARQEKTSNVSFETSCSASSCGNGDFEVVMSKESNVNEGGLSSFVSMRRGLSENYDGKCESFADLSEAITVKDLEKKEHPFNQRKASLKARKMYGRSMAQIASIEVEGQVNQQEEPKEAEQNLNS
ncbi:unnamed protein product [Dovyalis caffra]|uniref:Uncharacterized protein n=1 Tax=Dovyalis caffra TaxID=77055 RepID=A0AAV1RWZ7_9ROSI|nr:unnamed protein product [Dovyalis caffra]